MLTNITFKPHNNPQRHYPHLKNNEAKTQSKTEFKNLGPIPVSALVRGSYVLPPPNIAFKKMVLTSL